MNIARLTAAGLGTGWAPRAPGTAGSLLGLALGAVLLDRSRLWLGAGAMFMTALGCLVVGPATGQPWRGAKGAHDDPGWVVIDEVAGQMIAMLAMPRLSPIWAAAAFLLFRAFDILKPGPIGWADRQGGVLGIMLDDVLAAAAAALALAVLSSIAT